MTNVAISYSVLLALTSLLFLVAFLQWRPYAAQVDLPNYFAVTFQFFILLITFVFYLFALFPPSQFMVLPLADAAKSSIASIEWRYLKWALTTPLMVISFPLLLWAYYPRIKTLALTLRTGIILLMAMAFGYMSELFFVQDGLSAAMLGTLAIGLVLLVIVYVDISIFVFQAVNDLNNNPLLQEKGTLLKFFLLITLYIILVGWTIYPLGYVMGLIGGEWLVIRELMFSYGDIVNKLFFAFLVLRMALFLSDMKKLA